MPEDIENADRSETPVLYSSGMMIMIRRIKLNGTWRTTLSGTRRNRKDGEGQGGQP